MVTIMRGAHSHPNRHRGTSMIGKFAVALLLLLALSLPSNVYGKGQTDDCPPGSKDPDCAGKK